jgi:hypothetical protein
MAGLSVCLRGSALCVVFAVFLGGFRRDVLAMLQRGISADLSLADASVALAKHEVKQLFPWNNVKK